MNRINKLGLEIIQYKEELLKNYPELVRKSLIIALDQMVQTKMLDVDTYNILKDENTFAESFREYLLTKPSYSRTEEELFHEFEALRKILEEKLAEDGILDNLLSKSVVEKDIIVLTRKFTINESFAIEYFGVPEKDLLKLMNRGDFVEKFAVLRLDKIFKDFLGRLVYPQEFFICDVGYVYFDPEHKGYTIDFTFEVKVEQLENGENLEEICEFVKDIKERLEENYKQKMQC